MLVEDVQVDVRDAVVPRGNVGQEGEIPGESRAAEDVIDVGDGGAVLDEHRLVPVSRRDMRDGGMALDLGVLERLVAKVNVVLAADDGVNGRGGDVDQTDRRVCGRDGCSDGEDGLGC